MLLKQADSKEPQIGELQRLIQIAPSSIKPKIEQELRMLQAGIKGEKEAAYFIDFAFKDSLNTGIIHDLRLEINGRVAQIDHLLLNRTMTFYVLETKYFHAGIKIGEDGQFLKWNNFKKNFEGMPSPLSQNERHIDVLNNLITGIEWPTRLGLTLVPTFESFVLASSQARVDRPKKMDTSRVIKVDDLMKAIEKSVDSKGVLGAFGALAKVVSTETIQGLGQSIISFHRPLMPNYAARFGINNQVLPKPTAISPENKKSSIVQEKCLIPNLNGNKCRKCGANQLSIQYGRFGYYFKCSVCEGNTPIKLSCGQDGHKERLRKDGLSFYRECSDCGSSVVYFINPI